MRVWITKYTLTRGILCVEARETEQDGMIVYGQGQGTFGQYAHGEGRDWHRTKDAAVARAKTMVQKKRASLKKQIAKLDEWEPKFMDVE